MVWRLNRFREIVSRTRTAKLEKLHATEKSKALRKGAAAAILFITFVGAVAGLVDIVSHGAAVPLIISTSAPLAAKVAMILKYLLGGGRSLRRLQIIDKELTRRKADTSRV